MKPGGTESDGLFFRVASFTGAWVETFASAIAFSTAGVASFTGAWVETIHATMKSIGSLVVPYRGTWVETSKTHQRSFHYPVASFRGATRQYLGLATVLMFYRDDCIIIIILHFIISNHVYSPLNSQLIKLSISLFYHAKQNYSTLLLYTLLHNRHDVTYYLSETISKNESK